MLAVHIGVGHDDDPVVAQALLDRGIVGLVADVDADGGYQRADFVVVDQVLEAGLLDIERLAAQGQHGLHTAVAAGLGRAACRVTLHQEQLALAGVAAGAVEQLARQAAAAQDAAPLLERLAGAGGSLAGLGGQHHLLHDALGVLGVFLEELGDLLHQGALDGTFDIGVQQADLVLRLELRLGVADGDDRSHPLAEVLAGGAHILEQLLLLAVLGETAGYGGAEAGEVGAADRVVGVVGVAADALVVAGGELDGHLDLDVFHHAVDIDGLVDDLLGPVEPEHIFRDAAVVVVDLLAAGPQVLQLELKAAVEESQLAQAVLEGVEIKLQVAEDLGVGHEMDLGAVALGRADVLHLGDGHALLVALLVGAALAADGGHGPAGEGGHGLGAHAVEAGGGLVGALVELGARAHGGHHHLEGGLAGLGMHVHGDAAAVVAHEDGVVHIDLNNHHLAVAGQVLVHGVVDQLVNEVVQAAGGDVADVHARAAADVVGIAQHLDTARAIVGRNMVGVDFGGVLGVGRLVGHGRFLPLSLIVALSRCIPEGPGALSVSLSFSAGSVWVPGRPPDS